MSTLGSYRSRQKNGMLVTVEQFTNLAMFFQVYNLEADEFIVWMQTNGLYLLEYTCETCQRPCSIRKVKGDCGYAFKCTSNKNHQLTLRHNSFFKLASFMPQDMLLFTRMYLAGTPQHQISTDVGITKKSAGRWSGYIRNIMCHEVKDVLETHQLKGHIQIDESCFGHQKKYNRGTRNGKGVWLFGLRAKRVDAEGNLDADDYDVLIFPVEKRDKATLLPIIQKYVEPGSFIYSDGWGAYEGLNALGYHHFTVLHKYSFTQTYINMHNNHEMTINTNAIEGFWGHAKEHFRRIHGCNAAIFQSHLCEIMWRWWNRKVNVYGAFFDKLRELYPLEEAPLLSAQYPIFPENLCFTPMADEELIIEVPAEDDSD